MANPYTIKLNVLRALAGLRGDAARGFDAIRIESGRAIATDGKLLLVVGIGQMGDTCNLSADAVDSLLSACKSAPHTAAGQADVTVDLTAGTISCGGVTVDGINAVDSWYPDWRRVIPSDVIATDDVWVGLDPLLVSRLTKAMLQAAGVKALTDDVDFLWHTASSGPCVLTMPGMLGLVMPRRLDAYGIEKANDLVHWAKAD